GPGGLELVPDPGEVDRGAYADAHAQASPMEIGLTTLEHDQGLLEVVDHASRPIHLSSHPGEGVPDEQGRQCHRDQDPGGRDGVEEAPDVLHCPLPVMRRAMAMASRVVTGSPLSGVL